MLWNTAQGRLFAATFEVDNYLGDHFSLLALVPGLLYRIFANELFLFFFQTLMVTIAAGGIYKIFSSVTKNTFVALTFMLVFCFYIGVSGLLLFDIHIEVMALPLLVWGTWLYLVKKRNAGIILLLAALFAKEDVGIFVGSAGLAAFFFNRQKSGLLLFAAGIIFSVITIFIIIPAFRGESSDTLLRYSHLGATPSEIILSIINPLKIGGYLLQTSKIAYVIRLSFPLLFLPFFDKRVLLALPVLFINLISNYLGQTAVVNQYDMMTATALFFAAAYGYRNLETVFRKRWHGVNYKIFAAVLLIFFNLLLLPGHLLWRYLFLPAGNYTDYSYLKQLEQKLPQEAVIFATSNPGAVLSSRKFIYTYNPGLRRGKSLPDFVVIDKLRNQDELAVEPPSLYTEIYGYKIFEESESFLVLSKN
jgi:uncharacterized membrane protein